MKPALIAFACIVIYKLVRNVILYFRMKMYYIIYDEWTKSENCKHPFPKYAIQTAALMKRANVRFIMLRDEMKIPILSNLASPIPEIRQEIRKCFDMSLGVYSSRIKEALSPFYWIELVVFAPKNIIEYIGLNTDKTAAKISNVVLSALWWGVGLIWTCFHDQIQTWIVNVFSR